MKGFRKSLLGYNKMDVSSYLNEISMQHSDSLHKMEQQWLLEREELKAKIASLEKENSELLAEKMRAVDMIFSAQEYADQIKSIAKQEASHITSEAKEIRLQETARLDSYRQLINGVQDHLADVLQQLYRDLEGLKIQADQAESVEMTVAESPVNADVATVAPSQQSEDAIAAEDEYLQMLG